MEPNIDQSIIEETEEGWVEWKEWEEREKEQLINKAKLVSKRCLGYEVSQDELELMSYIQCALVSTKELDSLNLNDKYLDIFDDWHKRGFILCLDYETFQVSKPFWEAMGEILWELVGDGFVWTKSGDKRFQEFQESL